MGHGDIPLGPKIHMPFNNNDYRDSRIRHGHNIYLSPYLANVINDN